MKKIIESELISIAHRILKLKDKADVNALYVESKNVFEKIAILKFYEENKFRIDASITDEKIEEALSNHPNKAEQRFFEHNPSDATNEFSVSSGRNHFASESMEMDLINALIEDSENTNVISFDSEIADEEPALETFKNEDEIEEATINIHVENITDVLAVEDLAILNGDINAVALDENLILDSNLQMSLEAQKAKLEQDLEAILREEAEAVLKGDMQVFLEEQKPILDQHIECVIKTETEVFSNDLEPIRQSISEPFQATINEAFSIDTTIDSQETQMIEIDPIYNLSLEEIHFEEKKTAETEHSFTDNSILIADKPRSFDNQHLMNVSDDYEMPFNEIPINKTINDAFSKVITVGLNDRIGFEKNLFNGNSEDLNRVLSQLNTLESYQDAQDFIDDLVKPDFNNWKGKEEYEERFMQLIQKRFL